MMILTVSTVAGKVTLNGYAAVSATGLVLGSTAKMTAKNGTDGGVVLTATKVCAGEAGATDILTTAVGAVLQSGVRLNTSIGLVTTNAITLYSGSTLNITKGALTVGNKVLALKNAGHVGAANDEVSNVIVKIDSLATVTDGGSGQTSVAALLVSGVDMNTFTCTNTSVGVWSKKQLEYRQKAKYGAKEKIGSEAKARKASKSNAERE